MTLKQWLSDAKTQLSELGYASAGIDSELILAKVLNHDRTFIFANPDRELTAPELAQANTLLTRRCNHEPMAFILGTKEFFGLSFKADSRALIPRWESETLVEAALDWLKTQSPGQTVVELGTGAGGIIVALAKNAPNHHFYASDASEEALELARENAQALGVPNITLRAGDLWEPFTELRGKVNLLAANLPYIPHDELTVLDPTITYYEPDLALDGGRDGLDIYRRFFVEAPDYLVPGGAIICEHERDQGQAMQQLALAAFPNAQVKTLKDNLGDDRILICQV